MELREIDLRTDFFWIKIVGMLQQNWAVIRRTRRAETEIIFFNDFSVVFDKILTRSPVQAEIDLRRNKFLPYDDPKMRFDELVDKPGPPFRMGSASRRPIYSSGEYWL